MQFGLKFAGGHTSRIDRKKRLWALFFRPSILTAAGSGMCAVSIP
jgi:hypothetical protein